MSNQHNSGKKAPQNESLDGFQVGAEIGKGSFANVYKGIILKTHTPVAIKSVLRSKLKNKKLLENLEIEIQILKSLKHPHIVSLIDCQQSANYFHIIMEYCSLGDLSYFIRKRNQLTKTHPLISQLLVKYPSPENSNGLNRVITLHFLKQLASALQFLRSKNLVHRDIKPQNLLLCYPTHTKQEFIDKNYVGNYDLPILKIADFGFARFLPNQSLAETLCGSPLYMAPEILRYEKYNAKADLWSVGAVLYEMSVGRPPFRANNHVELLKKIENAHDNIVFPDNVEIDPDIKRLICGLLKLKSIERISFNEFFNDRLILSDLNEYINESQTLDHSSIDENLFISEYLPGHGNNTPQNVIDKTVTNVKQSKPRETTVPPKEEQRKKPSSLLKQQFERHFSTSEQKQKEELQRKEIEEQEQRQKLEKQQEQRRELQRQQEQRRELQRQQEQRRELQRQQEQRRELQRQQEQRQDMERTDSTHSARLKSSNNTLSSSKGKSNATDLLNEKDYVVVEKKSVEVNALADELANFGLNKGSNNGGVITKKDSGSQERRRRSSSSSQKRPSFGDRRFSISLAPSNALSKALVLASTRLFGNNTYVSKDATINDVSPSNIPTANTNINTNVNTNIGQNIGMYAPTISNDPYDLSGLIMQLESLAAKAHAVNLFAQVKYSQLIPFTPSSTLAIADDSDDEDENIPEKTSHLPPIAIKNISEEGLALYIKTLSLLAKAMNMTSEWWYSNENGILKTGGNDMYRFSPSNFDPALTNRLNSLVQWIREVFNECLDRADFIRLKLNEANQRLGLGAEAENLNSRVIAEKLIFDRALEISRNAAVNELVGEDLLGCELAYSTSIWMLEAILDNSEQQYSNNSKQLSGAPMSSLPHYAHNNASNTMMDAFKDEVSLDVEDKAMVQKFIASISNRLTVLRKKIEVINSSGMK